MTADRVLVAYASKHGSTAQMAENIALRLRKSGLTADALEITEIESPGNFSAFVVGSAVYAGRWLKEAADFLVSYQSILSKHPVWFFSAGPTGKGDPVEQMKGWRFPQELQPLADTIKPLDIAFFHGALDMAKLRLAEKLIVYALNAPAGDFRDWEKINDWADRIARTLKKGTV